MPMKSARKPVVRTNSATVVAEKAAVATRKLKTTGKINNSEESILTEADFLKILLKVKNGNFSERFPTDQNGIKRSICDTLNEIIDLNERMVFEFQKVGKSIGKQGKLT